MAGYRFDEEVADRARKELEGHTGLTDSEEEEVNGVEATQASTRVL